MAAELSGMSGARWRDGVAGSPQGLRQVMGQFVSGVTVVTAMHDGRRHAMTATAVSSVSLEPPLLLVCVGKASRFHDPAMAVDSWALSMLSAGQQPVAQHFADPTRDLSSQFDGIDCFPVGDSGAPVIDGAVAWVECRTYARYDGGDHTILIGQVVRSSPVDASFGPLEPVLGYLRGRYTPVGGDDPGSAANA